LSIAAHLLGRGLRVAVFGRPLGLWRDAMPAGMLLRSHWWATHLSDPRRAFGMNRFFRERRQAPPHPLPRETFVEYGLWFQARAVPHVEETYVRCVAREGSTFLVTLQDGRRIRSAIVVMALGCAYYAHRPAEYALPAPTVSHSCDHADFSRFRGLQVAVVGAGQSAIESAALLHEAGARVHVIARRPIVWLSPDAGQKRALLDRLRAPDAGIAPGWKNWVLDHAPYLFYRFPQPKKDSANRNYYQSAASDWLRDRVIGRVALHEGQTIARMDSTNGRVQILTSAGDRFAADHLLLATGYRVDLEKLAMIHPALRAEIRSDRGIPELNGWFESSVPGLYFVGLTSLRAFGPLYRFVAGAPATARRVAASAARRAHL
jgi:cation diffusion facilitator CzcD-associated flavoprotein CzcO